MPSRIRLDRAELSKIVGGNAKWIRAFEEMSEQALDILPEQATVILALLGAAQAAAADASGRADDAVRIAEETQVMLASLADYNGRISDLESLVSAIQGIVQSIPDPAEEKGVFYAIAGEAITAANPLVNVYNDAGTVKVRNAIGSALQYEAAGFVEADYATGASVKVKTIGLIQRLSGLTIDAYYFLSDTVAGQFTTTAPTASGTVAQNIGKAVSDTEISFLPQPGIIIS